MRRYAPVINIIGNKTETPLVAPAGTSYTIQKLQTEKCMYCTKLGEHGTAFCSYTRRVPKNAPVGHGCEVVCRNCEGPFSGTCCGLDEGRAILKECLNCGVYGDQWPRGCPRNNGIDNKFLDLPPGVFFLDFSRGPSAPGKVEQKEPAKPASVTSNAVKDNDWEDDHDSDDEDEETPTPKKGAQSDTPHPTRRERHLLLINRRQQLQSLLVVISFLCPATSHLVPRVVFSLTRTTIVLKSRTEMSLKHGGLFLIYNIIGMESIGEIMLKGFWH